MESEDVPDVASEPSGTARDYYVSYDHQDPAPEDREAHKVPQVKGPQSNTTLRPLDFDIHDLNRSKSESFLVLFIILGCILALGVLCNILVCYIYRCRSRRATSNFFVIFFSILDMFGCFIGIPLEMLALAWPYTYDMVVLCKIMGFVETLCICALCLTPICVAYDCHRRLCQTNDDIWVKKVRTLCIVSIVIATILSCPAFAAFDVKRVKIRTATSVVYGEACGISQDLTTWVRILYYVCVLFTFTASFFIMGVLYGQMGLKVLRQRQAEERGEQTSPAKREFPKKHRFVREGTNVSSGTNYNDEICRLHSQGSVAHNHWKDSSRAPLKGGSTNSGTGITKSNSLPPSSTGPTTIVQLHMNPSRQARMFLIISSILLITMLPFIVVSMLCLTTSVFEQFSSLTTEIVFNLCIRSYLLNYIVKPIVYIFFNVRFREEVQHLILKVWAHCRWSTAEQTHQQQSSRQLRRSFTMGPSHSASRTPIYRSPPTSS